MPVKSGGAVTVLAPVTAAAPLTNSSMPREHLTEETIRDQVSGDAFMDFLVSKGLLPQQRGAQAIKVRQNSTTQDIFFVYTEIRSTTPEPEDNRRALRMEEQTFTNPP